MAKIRTLKGVAHDVVDHCMSVFGWLHPHVWDYAQAQKFERVQIDLMSEPPIATPKVQKPLRLASAGLQEWFRSLLAQYGFTKEDLRSASLIFGAFGTDAYTLAATCIVVSRSGRQFRYDRGWPPNSALERTSARSLVR
jgi:hypothetical protein